MSQYCDDEDLPLFHRLQENLPTESRYGDYTDDISDEMYQDDTCEGWYAGVLDSLENEEF